MGRRENAWSLSVGLLVGIIFGVIFALALIWFLHSGGMTVG